MTLEKAFARVAELYAVYIQNPNIENPIAVALWQVSREALF